MEAKENCCYLDLSFSLAVGVCLAFYFLLLRERKVSFPCLPEGSKALWMSIYNGLSEVVRGSTGNSTTPCFALKYWLMLEKSCWCCDWLCSREEKMHFNTWGRSSWLLSFRIPLQALGDPLSEYLLFTAQIHPEQPLAPGDPSFLGLPCITSSMIHVCSLREG